MNEDHNLGTYRRRLRKNKIANGLTDNTCYLPATKNPDLTFDEWKKSRTNYPGSFADNNLYMLGESKQQASPNYDRNYGQQRQYDMPQYPYISQQEFRRRYSQTIGEYVVPDNIQQTVNPRLGIRKPGVLTPTGYRKPSKLDREIILAREARYEKMLDY